MDSGTLIALAALGYAAWKAGLLDSLLAQIHVPGDGGTGTGGGDSGSGGTPPPPPPPPGLTVEQACALAYKALAPFGFPNDCARIRQEVCGNRSLFTNRDPSSDEYKIRKAFGCNL